MSLMKPSPFYGDVWVGGGVEINRNEVSYEMGTQSRKPFQSKSHATNGTGIFTYMKTINLEEM